MLKTILSISGKPGLYKLVSHGKNMLIVESLTDNKRVPAYAKDKVISLGDIAIYTDETEVPLHEVLTSVKNKEEGKTASLVPSKATTDQLRAYFAEVLPSYDRDESVIRYLGKYTHRIAISNYRIKDMTESTVTFSAKDYKNQGPAGKGKRVRG